MKGPKKSKKTFYNTSKLAKLIFDFDDNAKSFITNKYKSSNKILVQEDIVYHASEADVCKLDIFSPELVVATKMPVMINVHGGGWVTGDKKWRAAQGQLFADMGMKVINLNYGLCPEYTYDKSVKHILLALRWLEDNAEQYDIDLDNVFIMGDSAGGQIACQICAVLHNKQFWERLGLEPVKYSLKGALLLCGAYDFAELYSAPIARDIIADMTGVEYDKIEEYEYNDMLYTLPWINEDFPEKVFIAYGKNDVFVGKHHIPLLARLDELGKDYVEYCGKFPGIHCFHLFYKTAESKAMYTEVKKYLMDRVRGVRATYFNQYTGLSELND